MAVSGLLMRSTKVVVVVLVVVLLVAAAIADTSTSPYAAAKYIHVNNSFKALGRKEFLKWMIINLLFRFNCLHVCPKD